MAPSSHEPPVDVEATPVEPVEGGSSVLVVKDCNPWTAASNEIVLGEQGISYDLINSAGFAGRDLAEYSVVLLPSTQTAGYYANLVASRGKLADFVSEGGTLVAHVTDDGWPCSTRWTTSFLPGGVAKANTFVDDLTVLAPSHPVVDGVSSDDLDDWNSSTHGYLTGLPASATTVIGIAGTGQPTYVEYPHGDGRVLATMQTMEWPWESGLGTKRLLRNEIAYAVRSRVSASLATLSFFPGLSENSGEGGDELNSALPHASDDTPVIDDWFHGDAVLELEDDLAAATAADKVLEEFPGETFEHYRFQNRVEVRFATPDDETIDEDSVEIASNDDTVDVTLESEGNPLRSSAVNDLLFGGDARKRATPRPRYLSSEITEIDGTDALRVSTIWGAFDPFVEIMLEYVADTTLFGLSALLGVPLKGLLAALVSTTPTIYTWIELTATADGTRLGRVWDASLFPGHVGYLDGEKADETPFDRGSEWEPRETGNAAFTDWIAEEQTHLVVPYESPHNAYLALFDGDLVPGVDAGPHPVMAFGRDADGTPLDDAEVRDRLPDAPLDPF